MLLAADLHYSKGTGRIPRPLEGRVKTYGLEFLQRVRKRIRMEKTAPDAVVLLGDLIDDGIAPSATEGLQRIKAELAQFKVPVIALPGNHDGDPRRFNSIFSKKSDIHFIKDYILFVFSDRYGLGDFARRREKDLKSLAKTAEKYPERKIIALQHSPVYPRIKSDYPYNLVNSPEIHDSYRRNRVLLSISGHYHPGFPGPARKDCVRYLTVPALCEEPFPFLVLETDGNRISLRRENLKDGSGLSDNHCHTEFAYCGEDVTMESVVERAELLGLEHVCFTEHAGQLYLSEKDYWSGRYFHEPSLLSEKKNRANNRMGDYRRKFLTVRSPFCRLGLEVETDKNGKLTLLPEDAKGWDLLLGAVHYLPPEILNGSSRELQNRFLRTCECLLKNEVNVLAHPFRFFRRHDLPAPKKLYKPLARMLKDSGAAAELNFHTDEPDPDFFQNCLKEGVKISLGTDSHNLLEAGELHPHLEFLKRLRINNLETVLWNPSNRAKTKVTEKTETHR